MLLVAVAAAPTIRLRMVENYANCEFLSGQARAASDILGRACEARCEPRVRRVLAEALAAQGRASDADLVARDLAGADRDLLRRSFLHRADAAWIENREDRALMYAALAAGLAVDRFNALVEVGRFYADVGDSEDALRALDDAWAAGDRSPDRHAASLLAREYFRLGQYQRVIDLLASVVQDAGRAATTTGARWREELFWLAYSYQQVGDVDLAKIAGTALLDRSGSISDWLTCQGHLVTGRAALRFGDLIAATTHLMAAHDLADALAPASRGPYRAAAEAALARVIQAAETRNQGIDNLCSASADPAGAARCRQVTSRLAAGEGREISS